MKHEKIEKLCLAAALTALVFVATYIIQIPMPATGGFVNLGDCMVLLSGFLLGPLWGAAAGGIGSMLTDIVAGYGSFAPGTLIIKALMACFAALLYKALKNRTKLASTFAAVLGEVTMVLGYFAYETLILGFGIGAAASIPGNIIQGVAGAAAGILVFQILKSVPYVKNLCK